jgi:hypothetical protein
MTSTTTDRVSGDRRWYPGVVVLLVMTCLMVLRLGFIPGQGERLTFDPDEAEMHDVSLGPVLGTVPQRLIWPGGLMRHVALLHLGASAILQDVPRTPEGLAAHIGRVLLEPGQAWAWMRWTGAFASALGFALPVGLAMRLGVPWTWAAALALAAACFPLHWRHGCMTTPDALAWGLALVALTVARAGPMSVERVFGSALLTGLALGSKLTLLPMMPALALACWDRRLPWMKLLLAWSCGLLLGMLVATPWFLADPVRLVKTMLGVVKFKPGEATGAAETLRLMLTGIPVWLIAAGLAGLVAAFWNRQGRMLASGAGASALWLLKTAMDSKQVVDRYFPPLGMLLFFAAMVWVLPLLAVRLQGRRRVMISAGLVLLAVLTLVQGWRAMDLEWREMESRHAAHLEVLADLQKTGATRIALDATLFRSPMSLLADAASFDAVAEHLEQERVGHRGVEEMLGGYGLSGAAVRVLGGLFDEVEANQSARLRAMAAGTRGRQRVWWFNASDNPVYGRQWMQDGASVEAALADGGLDVAVFAGKLPASLSGFVSRSLPGRIPLHVVHAVRKTEAK